MNKDLKKSLAKPLDNSQFSSRYDSIEEDELIDLPLDPEVFEEDPRELLKKL